MSTQVYKGIKEKGATFFCYACCLEKHRREIDGLNAAVDQLEGEIVMSSKSVVLVYLSETSSMVKSGCGYDRLFSCQKSRSVVNDSAIEISSPHCSHHYTPAVSTTS